MLTIEGRPLVPRGFLDHYFYEVDEGDNPDPALSQFARGGAVDPADLYAAAANAAPGVAHSESATALLATLRRRLREEFPAIEDAPG